MYKIINQLTNQEETFEYRDDLLSRLEIINERMKSNKINGIYRLYSLNSEGEILQEESLEIPFVGIIDQLLENFGMSAGKKKKGLLHFLEKHKEKNSSLGTPEIQLQPEFQPEPDPELEDLTVTKEANMARQIIAELVSQKPRDEVREEVPLEDKMTYSSSEWTTDHFSRLDENEEERVEPSQDMPTQEVVSIVEKSTQEEKIPLSVKEDKGNVETSFSLSHVTSVNLPSEVIDSFEAQTVTYKQSIKHKIQSNEEFIKEANEEINECQNKINELRQQILAKEKQASQLKDLYFKIEEVS
ncbi:TPA: hypothetical protein VZJ95_001499 [Streptococcus pneumoniae]|uniref:Uncharacterized protein n=2 Tax=Streptococcus pneumoniae TaxID=1313 RepID=A0A064C221_STREE|nr:hypothetical protein [Streptococcus pneumoniae]EPD19458.1 hypothetical protein SP4UMMC_09119 [Streptococcus pneumoniae MNZ14]EPD21444.1 hypothetical protein SP6UMMC_02372 [Streptococcus pneumoniae MNZ41]EPF48775.1 hypothetical protein SP7UMMC_08121 [Streptococcus pneumoniae MNZ85]ETE02894.1 hypothetical protein U756_01995 [Streptococcus pneumoniae 27]ETE15129.1 hypothetical protein U754_06810 [Streptococcus pneumoniae 13856]ETE24749.1 hypothetical protein U755_08885 [Streptococcus pneumoni